MLRYNKILVGDINHQIVGKELLFLFLISKRRKLFFWFLVKTFLWLKTLFYILLVFKICLQDVELEDIIDDSSLLPACTYLICQDRKDRQVKNEKYKCPREFNVLQAYLEDQ